MPLPARLPERLKKIAAFSAANFGPLLVFYGINALWGLRAAIAGTLVTTAVEIFVTLRRGEKPTGFFIFSVIVTVGFGIVDLCLVNAVLFKFEPALTNIVTGGFFGFTALQKRPLLVQMAEKSGRIKAPLNDDAVFYFRVFTLIWTVYFFVKAWMYYDLALVAKDVNEILFGRFWLGNGSMLVMLAASLLGGKYLALGLRRLKLMPSQRQG